MKTTVELPDDLLIKAKKSAAESRVPLRQLIEEGLRARLSPSWHKGRQQRRKLKLLTVDGGLPLGMDVADREQMYDLMKGDDS